MNERKSRGRSFRLAVSLARVVHLNPLPITSAGHILRPRLIFKIPANRLANARLKSLFRFPSQLAFNLACIHRVAAVVAGTVLHECNQAAPRTLRAWSDFIDQIANRLDDFDVWLLIPPADVIGLSGR